MLCATAIFYHMVTLSFVEKCGLNILAMFNLNTEKGHDAVTCHCIVKY